MTCFVSHTSVDCLDAYALSEWWRTLLGYETDPDDPNEPGHEERAIQDPDTGHVILFLEVPDAKRVKNRLHLDLRPRDGVTRDEEIQRVLGLGATAVEDHRTPDGLGWLVLADPEGNEFCILRSPAERERS
ncbi:VOC family protein [Kytococcus sp. Marseille-QA3725]